MPGSRAVQNLQMPHPRDWQGGQMPRSSPGGGGWAQVQLIDALSEKYKTSLEMFKTFYSSSDWRMICFYSNIGCSESKVIFKWLKNNNNNTNKKKSL